MAAEQRKLLEQLMGAAHTNPLARAPQLSLTDPKVCRSYIVGTCPRELFTNTKQDSGPCPKVHAEALKTEWDELPEHQKQRMGFEFDYLRDLQKYIEQCNQRIQSAQLRLEKTPDEIRQTNVLLQTISDLTASVNAGLLEAEILGELGEVHRAADELFRVRQAQQAKADRERELKALSETQGPSGHQKLQVCDVCGAYLSRLDNDRRLADHFYGKMHLGYAQMRKAWESFPKEMKARIGGRGDRGGGYDDEFDRDRDRDRDRGDRDRGDRGFGGARGGRSGGGGYRGGRGRGYRGGW